MAASTRKQAMMDFDGLKLVEKNTFLHFLTENGDDEPRMSRRNSAPEISAFVLSSSDDSKQIKTLLCKQKKQQTETSDDWTRMQSTSCIDTEEEDKEEEKEEEEVRTLMIRGLPGSCKREDILKAIDELGFKEQHDFFYAPLRKNKTLGYAFIGFPNAQLAMDFSKCMTGYKFGNKCSSKVVTITPATIQGLSNIMDHFKDTYVMKSDSKPWFLSKEA